MSVLCRSQRIPSQIQSQNCTLAFDTVCLVTSVTSECLYGSVHTVHPTSQGYVLPPHNLSREKNNNKSASPKLNQNLVERSAWGFQVRLVSLN